MFKSAPLGADAAVGGSGSGPHTYGCAADAYFYKNGQPVESRLIACYLHGDLNERKGRSITCLFCMKKIQNIFKKLLTNVTHSGII